MTEGGVGVSFSSLGLLITFLRNIQDILFHKLVCQLTHLEIMLSLGDKMQEQSAFSQASTQIVYKNGIALPLRSENRLQLAYSKIEYLPLSALPRSLFMEFTIQKVLPFSLSYA